MTPDPTVSQVAAQEPQNPEFAECGVCHGYYSRCVMPCPYSGAPTQEPAGKPMAVEPLEFTATDMQNQWDEARRREREYWERHMRGLHAERDQYRAAYENLLQQVADLRAFAPAPPIMLTASPQPTTSAQEPLTNIACDVIDGYKAGLAGEPMGMVSAAFDCGWISGDTERRAALAAARKGKK